MNDIDIIKALECCGTARLRELHTGENPCSNCPMQDCEDCEVELPDCALDLIYRQQMEIEKAKSEVVKEFAEKLKTEIAGLEVKSPNTTYKCGMEDVLYYRMPKVIDRLVEEMGCDDG